MLCVFAFCIYALYCTMLYPPCASQFIRDYSQFIHFVLSLLSLSLHICGVNHKRHAPVFPMAGSAMHEKVDEQMAALKIIRKTKEATEPADVK